MSVADITFDALWPLVIAIELLVTTLIMGSRLRPHEGTGGRLALVVTCVCAVALAIVLSGLSSRLSQESRYLEQLIVFVGVLATMMFIVRFVFFASTWSALFCATTAYTMQNLASGVEQLLTALLSGNAGLGPVPAELATPASAVLVYGLCYAAFIRKINRSSLEQMRSRLMIGVFVAVAFAVIGFDILIKSICFEGVSWKNAVLLRVAHILVCCFVLVSEYEILYVQQLRADKLSIERMLAERGRQYEMARGNIEAINVKCHDIKHQIRTLSAGGRVADQAALDDLAHEVAIYDSSIETGNEALDTILTEKGLVCERSHITLSCIVDGASLDFMAPSDLYAFFGNALDNAIEAVSALENDERRSISLVVKRRGSMVSIHAENFFDGRLTFFGGLPRTTKADVANHGFGIKSMRLIAEKYEGSLTTSAENGIFRLDAVIPRPRTT
ncbi:MAG TPA: ATP-binding protein [Candidatus Olsenella pullicola]|nr:ATP-binding protein [Candidatus Olsenella pullicola]